jgi:hypothetical protein
VATSYARWKPNDYAFDFFPRWYGARQVLLEGEDNPYSQEIEDEVQTYQQFDDPQANLPNFLYPAPIIYILSPFWILPWEISINLWTGLALTLSLVLPLAVYLILDWRIPPILLALLTFFSVFIFRHTMINYIIGQFVVFVLGNLILAWWAASNKKPAISALALVAATIRPEGAIIAATSLADLLWHRHFKTIAIFTAVMGGILIISLIQLGWWVDNMVDVLQEYSDCCTYAYPPSEAPAGQAGEVVFTLIVIAWAAWMLLPMRHLPDLTRIPWSLSTVIVTILLISIQSKPYTLVYLLVPLWVSVWSTRGHWMSSFAVLAVMTSPWVFAALNLTLADDNPKEQLLTPVLAGIVLTVHWLQWSKEQQAATNSHTHPTS